MRLKIKSDYFIVEFSSHFHTVIPWVKFFPDSKRRVFISAIGTKEMNNFLEIYNESVSVSNIKILSWSIIKNLFLKLQKPKLILTTAPEHKMSTNELFSVFICFVLKPEILCIRNPAEWTEKNSYSNNSSFKLNVLAKTSNLLLRVLAKRAKKIVCETQDQAHYIMDQFGLKKNVFEFSGRVSDLTPLTTVHTMSPTKVIIGVLGSVDIERRNYAQLEQSLRLLPGPLRPEIAFLGRVKNDSNFIVEKFQELTTVSFWSLDFVDEKTFFSVGTACSLLIAPLNPNKKYGEIYGSGSFADAIALNRYLLLPSHVPVPNNYKNFVKTYDSHKTLSEFILRVDALIHPFSNGLFSIFGTESIKKKLDL